MVSAIVNAAREPTVHDEQADRRRARLRAAQRRRSRRRSPRCSADPLETTVFVFVGGGGRAPKALLDALKSAEVVGPDSEKTSDVLAAELERADLKLDGEASPGGRRTARRRRRPRRGARRRARRPRSVPASRSNAADVEPYLGEMGSVPVFQLTNAIEEGQVAGALVDPRPAAHRHERPPAEADAPAAGPRHAAVALPQAAARRRPGDPHDRRGARRARREGEHVPGAEGARGVTGARHRRAHAGRSTHCTRPTSTSRARARCPRTPCSRCWCAAPRRAAQPQPSRSGGRPPRGAASRGTTLSLGGSLVRGLHEARGAAGELRSCG